MARLTSQSLPSRESDSVCVGRMMDLRRRRLNDLVDGVSGDTGVLPLACARIWSGGSESPATLVRWLNWSPPAALR